MSYRVLIVDDSPAMRGFIERVINISGFEIAQALTAGNGNEALAILAGHPVDLILTDVNMPESGGEDLIRKLSQNQRLRSIPVIVVSTDATQARLEQLTKLGAKGYVVKPFTPERLRSTMEQVLGITYA